VAVAGWHSAWTAGMRGTEPPSARDCGDEGRAVRLRPDRRTGPAALGRQANKTECVWAAHLVAAQRRRGVKLQCAWRERARQHRDSDCGVALPDALHVRRTA